MGVDLHSLSLNELGASWEPWIRCLRLFAFYTNFQQW